MENSAYSFLLYTQKALARLKKKSWKWINIYSLNPDLRKHFIVAVTEINN